MKKLTAHSQSMRTLPYGDPMMWICGGLRLRPVVARPAPWRRHAHRACISDHLAQVLVGVSRHLQKDLAHRSRPSEEVDLRLEIAVSLGDRPTNELL